MGTPLGPPGGYRLVRPAVSVSTPPELDAAQRTVVGHTRGPLLALGAPGTGKTTTLVESVAARAAEVPADRILILTFGRRMATRLRRQLAVRLGDRSGAAAFSAEPVVRTFHGYAFGLLRRAATARGAPEPRLLSGPEQDLAIRELIEAGVAEERFAAGWPETLRPALRTRGFASELRDLLLRAAERGIPAERLADWGHDLGRPDWPAAARFATQYAEVLALRDAAGHGSVAYDPAELIRAAIGLLTEDAEVLAAERDRFRYCYVDELHDSDPAQLELLELVAGGGRHLVAFGDPDSSTFAFRGADPAGVTGFPARFPTAPGTLAPTVVLWT
ncbi:MAG: UvrD-helicase domain-containing protein, partial [Actinocatenispora sp.]